MGPMCVTLPNFIKIGQMVAEIWRFNNFHNVGRPPSWILEIQFFLTIWALKRPILRNHAKFHEDLSKCQSLVVISRFVWFSDDDHRHLVFFEKMEILTMCPLSGANLHHRAKFHQNRSNGCRDWRFNGIHIGGRPPSWILEIEIF